MLVSGLTTYLLEGSSLSINTKGFCPFTILKIKVSEDIILIKSITYLPFTAKVSASPSIIAGISVVPAPLSVFPEEIITFVA